MPMAIAGALFAFGAPLAVVNFFAIGFGVTLVNAVVGIGISLAANLLFRGARPTAPSIKPSDGQQTIRQAVPPRWKSYGVVRVSGPIWWYQADGITGQLYIGLILNEGEIQRITDYHIDDTNVDVDVNTRQVSTAPYDSVTTRLVFRWGRPNEQQYNEIESVFGLSDVRGDGVATILGIFDDFADPTTQLKNYPNAQPRLRVTMESSRVWDPRATDEGDNEESHIADGTPTAPLGGVAADFNDYDWTTSTVTDALTNLTGQPLGDTRCVAKIDFGATKTVSFLEVQDLLASSGGTNAGYGFYTSPDNVTWTLYGSTFSVTSGTPGYFSEAGSVACRYVAIMVPAINFTGTTFTIPDFNAYDTNPAPPQLREDKTTWRFSENPVVCLLDYLLSPDGFAIPYSKIEPVLDEWITAMNICDEQVYSQAAGGDENRYRVGGSYLFTDRPTDVVQRFLDTFDGKLWQKRGGTLGILAGEFIPPTVSIDDSEILDYELVRGRDPIFSVGGIKAQFMSPANDYREQDAEAWPTGEIVVALTEQERVVNLDLMWTPSHSQCRRLMKRRFVKESAGHTGNITCSLSALRAIDKRYINLTIDELGLATASFEIERFTIDFANAEIRMDVTQVGPEIDDWDPTTEEGVAPIVAEGLVWVEKDDGELFGNFVDNTGGGGGAFIQERLFDSNYTESFAANAFRQGLTGYFGKSFLIPKIFGKAQFTSSLNGGFIALNGGSNQYHGGSITVTVRGKNGAVPVDGDDGDLIGTVTFDHESSTTEFATVLSTNTVDAWDHWVYGWSHDTGNAAVDIGCAEADHWEWQAI